MKIKKFTLLFILSAIAFGLMIFEALSHHKSGFLFFIALFVSFFFLGLSFRLIEKSSHKLTSFKKIFFWISIGLILGSLLSKYLYFPGSNFMGFLGIFLYCFSYAPIELTLKYNKWRLYTSNKTEILLLSSMDFVGVNLILIGMLSYYLNWPFPFILIYSGGCILIVGLFLWNNNFKKEIIKRKESEDLITLQYKEISKEKEASEALLLNILPTEVAQELKLKGNAEAKLHNEVTVLFCDIKDFTQLSEMLSATELVAEINYCFVEFDKIMDRYGLEKIKTIGDCYMCAGGLPVSKKTHAKDVVRAALEMQNFVKSNKNIFKNPINIRIGIHSGPVVAGIVGIKKFAYDIWGDTVNIASRMESSGEVGKVNLSQNTYELIKHEMHCTYRGKIDTKGKGLLDMYFVEEH